MVEQHTNIDPVLGLAHVNTQNRPNTDPVLELVDVTMEDIPEGPLDLEGENPFYAHERSIQPSDTSTNGKLNKIFLFKSRHSIDRSNNKSIFQIKSKSTIVWRLLN